MAEELEIKVKADTGEAVANLGKTEKAVAGVTKEVKTLDGTSSQAGKKGLGTDLADGLNKTTGGFSRLLEATGKISLIFGAAVVAGKALAAGIDAIADSLGKAAQRQMDAEARTIKFDSALRLAQKGTIALGHSTEEMLKNYDAYVAKISKATDATTALAHATALYQMEVAGVADAIAKAGAGRGFTIISPEDINKQLDQIKTLATSLNKVLGEAFEEGGAAARDAWATANEESVQKVIAAYEKAGRDIPENLRPYSEALKRNADDARQWAADVLAEAAAVDAAVKQSRAAEDAASNRTSRAPEQFRYIQDAAVGAAVAAGEFGSSLDRVAEVVVATGGTMTVGTTMMIQYAEATREATQALLDQAVASRALREEQAQALEAVKGWTDYVLTLQQGYESGATSLYNYVTQLAAFKTQLLQLFGGVTGQAKEELQAMIDLIQKLISTAGAGGPVAKGGGFKGQFQRDANRRG